MFFWIKKGGPDPALLLSLYARRIRSGKGNKKNSSGQQSWSTGIKDRPQRILIAVLYIPLEIHCYHTISRTQCGNNKNIQMHVFLITTTRHGSCTLDQMRRRYHGLWGTKEGNAIRARRAKHAPGRSFCVQTTACFFSS